MQIGSYMTKYGRRFRLELKNSKVIEDLTEEEFNEIYYGIKERIENKRFD